MPTFRTLNLLVFGALTTLLVLAFTTNAYAGAWMLPKGQFYMELYAKHYYADSDFDSDSTGKIAKNKNGAYHETYLEYKLEYGLFDKLSLLLNIPYKFALSEEDILYYTDQGEYRNTGLGDIALGFKYNVFQKPIVTSMQFKLFLPTQYDNNETPALGPEYAAGEIRLLLGKSFEKIPSFIGAEVGYKGRGGKNTDDEIPYMFELGWFPNRRIMLKGLLDGVEGLAGSGPEEDYAKWGFSIGYSPIGEYSTTAYRTGKALNLELGYNNTFKGKNTGAGNEIVGKVIYQF